MFRHSQTHTPKEIQNITEIIIGRDKFWDDVNPKRLIPDMSFILRIWEVSTKIVPPKNISWCYCKNFEIIIWVMYDCKIQSPDINY